MIVLVVPILLILLWFAAAKARRAGLSFIEVTLLVVVGIICIAVLTFGILLWGFQDFG